jgi:anti-anti-sigma factor
MTISMCDSGTLFTELVDAEPDGKPDDVLVAHLHGPLDLSTAPALDRTLQCCLDGSTTRRMLLDLTDVHFLDCRGVAVLVRLARRVQDREGERPHLVGLSTRARRVLELAEVIDMFAVDDTIEGALARIQGGAVR